MLLIKPFPSCLLHDRPSVSVNFSSFLDQLPCHSLASYVRLLPHLGFRLSRLSDTSLKILPHCFSSLCNFSTSGALLLSLTFNQSCLAHIQISSQPICLILTLPCYVRLLAHTHFQISLTILHITHLNNPLHS